MLDDPEQDYVFSADRSGAPRRSSSRSSSKLRPDYGEDFAGSYDDVHSQDEDRPRQRGLKLKLRANTRSVGGRVITGVALLLIAGIGVALLMLTRSFLLHDERFMIRSPSSIEIQGNKHLTQNQLLGIFGNDVERNIFRISLVDRQAELEQLPWVEKATVMRLLPNHIRVSVVERIPIAFARQGAHIGLVDANGVLLEMAAPGSASVDPHYSFPVVTGLSAADPASTRGARMKIFQRFTGDLDSSGEKISQALSEVDLSNPEDVKALIPANSTDILVHFGDDHFLERYRTFQAHLPAWHTQYPNLASVDMRYEREVVLNMAGSTTKDDAVAPNTKAVSVPSPPVKVATPTKPTPLAKPVAVATHGSVPHVAVKSPIKASIKTKSERIPKAVPHKPVAPAKKPQQSHAAAASKSASNKPVPKRPVASHVAAVAAHSASVATAPSASAAARSSFGAKPAAGKPLLPAADLSHSSQVPSR